MEIDKGLRSMKRAVFLAVKHNGNFEVFSISEVGESMSLKMSFRRNSQLSAKNVYVLFLFHQVINISDKLLYQLHRYYIINYYRLKF